MNDFELNTKLKIKSMWICIALYAAGSLLSFFSIALGDVFVFLVGFFVWLFYFFLSEAITVICIVSGVRQTVAAKRHAPISDKPCNALIPIFSILNMALFVAAFFIFPPTNDSRNGVSSLDVTFIAIQIVYCVFDIIFLLRYRKYRRLCKASASAPTLTSTLASAPASASVPAQSQFASTPVQSQPVPSQFLRFLPSLSRSLSLPQLRFRLSLTFRLLLSRFRSISNRFLSRCLSKCRNRLIISNKRALHSRFRSISNRMQSRKLSRYNRRLYLSLFSSQFLSQFLSQCNNNSLRLRYRQWALRAVRRATHQAVSLTVQQEALT